MIEHILVIDDDHFVRALLCKGLKRSGYDVTEATDGAAAMKLIDAGFQPSLVLTDVIMPNKDGLEIILEIRKKCPDVKVITMSGSGFEKAGDYLEMSLKLGSDAAFPKPVNFAKLEKVIADLLDGHAGPVPVAGFSE